MKTGYVPFLLLILTIWAVRPGVSAQAQASSDTLVVQQGLNTLLNAVMGDTLANGQRANPNRVYKLLRGGRYFIQERLDNTNWHLRLVGEPGTATTPPPVVQIANREDGSFIGNIIRSSADVTIKNIYFIVRTTLGGDPFIPFQVRGAGARFVMDNAVIDHSKEPVWRLTADDISLYVTNTKFRNMLELPAWWKGRGALAQARMDTIWFENNTFFNVGGVIYQNSSGKGDNFFWYNHNTVYNTRSWFWPTDWRAAVLTNNLTINAGYPGYTLREINPNADGGLVTGHFTIDTLGTELGIPESDRRIFYSTNAFDTTPEFEAWYAAQAAVTDDSARVRQGPILDSRAQAFFDAYPKMTLGPIIANADPGFIKAPNSIPLLIKWLEEQRSNPVPSTRTDWSWDPDGSHSIVTWPLPENLAYTNAALMTASMGNLPLGDLNWFPAKKQEWMGRRAQLQSQIMTALNQGTTAAEPNDELPEGFVLEQNYPNPFNPSTTIGFMLPEAAEATLTVYDVLGRKLAVAFQGPAAAGVRYQAPFNAGDLPSGIYFYRLQTSGRSAFSAVGRMTLLK